MNLKVYKILRTVCKILLILIGAGIIGYLGYLIYISYKYPPYKVTISNVTDSSFTVSWVTDTPTKGYIYYKGENSFLPGPLGWIGSGKAYDDRDWAYNQSACVNEFNANAEIDENFTVVNSGNFNCEDIKIEKAGNFYTHHITLKNLEDEKDYYFRIGNGFWMWNVKENNTKTFSLLSEIKEPLPVFGKIIFSEGIAFNDSIIYGKFLNGRESKESMIYSSVTNEEGGWYLDGSAVRTEIGELVNMESGEDMFRVTGQFLNAGLSEVNEWVFGAFDGAYPDIVVGKDLEIVKGESDVKGISDNEGSVLGLWDWIKDPIGEAKKLLGIVAVVSTAIVSPVVNSTPAVTKSVSSTPSSPTVVTSLSIANKVVPNLVNAMTTLNSNDTPTKTNVTSSNDNASSKTITASLADYESTTSASLTNASESEKRKALCPTCSTFVTSAQMQEILKDPNKAAGYVSNIGAGNVSRILASAGIDIGKEALGYMGLNYNAGNLNALSVLQGGEGNKAITQKEFETLGDDVVISTKSEPDSSGKTTFTWISPIKKVAPVPAPELGGNEAGPIVELVPPAASASVTATISSSVDTSEITNQTGGLLFSNAAFKLPIEFTSEGLKITTYTGDKKPARLSFNMETQKYEITDLIGLGQYIMAGIYETAASLGQDIVSAALKKIPVISLQDPFFIGPPTSTTVGAQTETIIPISLRAPIIFKSAEEDILLGTVINISEGMSDIARQAEELVLSQVCITDGSQGISGNECQAKGVKIRMVETASASTNSLLNRFGSNVYAQSVENDDFIFYASEDGIIDISVDGIKVAENIETSGNELVILYTEGNGVDGYQFPVDWENPKSNEDKVVFTNSLKIEVEKKSTIEKLELKEGINIVSFNSMLLTEGANILTASGLLERYPDSIQFVADYSSGRWSNIMRNDGTESNGTDFEIVPGKGYLIYSRYDTVISLSAYGLKTSIPIYFSNGWNLIGIHGYSNAFTARSLIDSINNIDTLAADNVSWWLTSKGKYEGLQVTDGISYGLDFPISTNNGYFVRIKDFKPVEENCNSIIWQEGAGSNGTCGSN